MDFATAISTCMVKKYADFSGRASRLNFGLSIIFFNYRFYSWNN